MGRVLGLSPKLLAPWDSTFRRALRMAAEHCPRGDGRGFGPCRAANGVAVQERAVETTVLVVAYDVTVTTTRGERELTVVVRVVG